MEFGFVTDELDLNPRRAIETALAWDIRKFEIRFLPDGRFPKVSDTALDELARLREEHNIEYTAVSPGFFKCHLDDKDHIAYALGDGLERAMDFMEGCGVPLMVCFGFEMATGDDAQAVALLQRFADRLAERQLAGAVENETHCKFDTPERIDHLLRQVGRPNLGANWDLANLQQGAPAGFPGGYERVKPRIVNVHAKDVVNDDDGTLHWLPIGEGVCDWPGQMHALVRDQIVDHVTIENHCGPLVEVGRHNLDLLRQYAAEAEE